MLEEKLKEQDIVVDLDDSIRAKLIRTSLNIVETIQSGESEVEEKRGEKLEEIYSEKILQFLPNEVDELCLKSNKRIARQEENFHEKPLIWGEEEVQKYLNKLEGKSWWK